MRSCRSTRRSAAERGLASHLPARSSRRTADASRSATATAAASRWASSCRPDGYVRFLLRRLRLSMEETAMIRTTIRLACLALAVLTISAWAQTATIVPSDFGDEFYRPRSGQAGKDVVWVPTPCLLY